jgi:hypothetical protein
VLLFLVVLLCSNPEDPRNSYILSSKNKADITSLAQSIRNVQVDSITIEDDCMYLCPCCSYCTSPCSVGVVHFQPKIFDSNEIVFSSLLFCNTKWPCYSRYFNGDTGVKISNEWATSPQQLRLDSAIIVTFDQCSLFVHTTDTLPKDTVMYYLNNIYSQKYLPPWCDSCDSIIIPLCGLSKATISHYSISATNIISLTLSSYCHSNNCTFVEFNGQLSLLTMSGWCVP